jgi:hypothetical protein
MESTTALAPEALQELLYDAEPDPRVWKRTRRLLKKEYRRTHKESCRPGGNPLKSKGFVTKNTL